MTQRICARCTAALVVSALLAGPLRAEQILIVPDTTLAVPSTTVSVFFELDQSAVPLFGYSLGVRMVPNAGAVGAVSANVGLTNFYDAQNLITAGGAVRDPFFSDISGTAEGVFITTNTDDLSTVTAVDGINDVLAQVYFDISADALGDFAIELGDATALSDGAGFPVSFEYTPATIRVVPEPATFALLLTGTVFSSGRRKLARQLQA